MKKFIKFIYWLLMSLVFLLLLFRERQINKLNNIDVNS